MSVRRRLRRRRGDAERGYAPQGPHPSRGSSRAARQRRAGGGAQGNKRGGIKPPQQTSAMVDPWHARRVMDSRRYATLIHIRAAQGSRRWKRAGRGARSDRWTTKSRGDGTARRSWELRNERRFDGEEHGGAGAPSNDLSTVCRRRSVVMATDTCDVTSRTHSRQRHASDACHSCHSRRSATRLASDEPCVGAAHLDLLVPRRRRAYPSSRV